MFCFTSNLTVFLSGVLVVSVPALIILSVWIIVEARRTYTTDELREQMERHDHQIT